MAAPPLPPLPGKITTYTRRPDRRRRPGRRVWVASVTVLALLAGGGAAVAFARQPSAPPSSEAADPAGSVRTRVLTTTARPAPATRTVLLPASSPGTPVPESARETSPALSTSTTESSSTVPPTPPSTPRMVSSSGPVVTVVETVTTEPPTAPDVPPRRVSSPPPVTREVTRPARETETVPAGPTVLHAQVSASGSDGWVSVVVTITTDAPAVDVLVKAGGKSTHTDGAVVGGSATVTADLDPGPGVVEIVATVTAGPLSVTTDPVTLRV